MYVVQELGGASDGAGIHKGVIDLIAVSSDSGSACGKNSVNGIEGVHVNSIMSCAVEVDVAGV